MEWTVVLWKLGEGLLVSLGIFAITLLFSLPLGLLVAFGRMHKNPLISGIIKIYISFMRGTPLMLQLFMVYYGPYYIFKVSLHPGYRMTAVYIGFILNYAAYFAEIYRSGIQSMDRGQYEAAEILGYSKMQCFFPGLEEDSSFHYQRGDFFGKGYFFSLFHFRDGNVYPGQGPVFLPELYVPLDYGRSALLHFQFCGSLYYGTDGKEDGVLSIELDGKEDVGVPI